MKVKQLVLATLLLFPVLACAQSISETLAQATGASAIPPTIAGAACPSTPTVIYDTTHAANQGAEITAAANGPGTCMGDKIVLSAATTQRRVCEVVVEVFTLTDLTPFDLTMEFYTDCTTDGSAGSSCGNGTGTLIPGSTTTVTGITPPGLGQLFAVSFPYPGLIDLSGEADNTISVKLNASRADVFWRINETPVVGALPAGEPATSFVERCGSAGSNNGCQRNFGVDNNFGMTINAIDGSPPALVSGTKTVAGSFQPGGAVTYTVVINNTGAGTQGDNPGNEFTDILPASLVLTSATATSGTAVATLGTNTVTWNGSIAPAGSVTITINATVSAAAAPGTVVSNQGTISFDGNGDNVNESTAITDDPSVGGASDSTDFVIPTGSTTAVDLPSLGTMAQILMVLLLALFGFSMLRNRMRRS